MPIDIDSSLAVKKLGGHNAIDRAEADLQAPVGALDQFEFDYKPLCVSSVPPEKAL
jgi:hypothetical protein